MVGLERWVPSDLEHVLDLIDALVDAGFTRAKAAGLAEWLLRRSIRADDRTPQSTRSAYRAMLRTLETNGYSPSRVFRGSSIGRASGC